MAWQSLGADEENMDRVAGKPAASPEFARLRNTTLETDFDMPHTLLRFCLLDHHFEERLIPDNLEKSNLQVNQGI
jgi:hypothetical protein